MSEREGELLGDGLGSNQRLVVAERKEEIKKAALSQTGDRMMLGGGGGSDDVARGLVRTLPPSLGRC